MTVARINLTMHISKSKCTCIYVLLIHTVCLYANSSVIYFNAHMYVCVYLQKRECVSSCNEVNSYVYKYVCTD